MPNYFYGSDGLVEAITSVTGSDVNIRIANDMVLNAYRSAGLEGVKQLAGDYGINYVTFADKSTPAFWSVNALEGATPTSAEVLYPAVLDTSVDAGTNELVIETAKQTATEGGKLFSKGAIKTATTAISVVGAIVTGVELGWESYKAHPDFWTDLSESIFNSNDPDTPIEVLARAHSGGYTTAVKEKEACRILQELAEQGCFDYTEYDSTIPQSYEGGTEIDVAFTSVNPVGTACSLAYGKAQELFTGIPVNCYTDWETTDDWGRPVVRASVTLHDTSFPSVATVYKTTNPHTGESTYYTALEHCNGVSIDYYPSTGQYYFNPTSDYTTNVYSGNYTQVNGQKCIGGLNVDKTVIKANNELFTNDHSGNALSIAPTSTISQIAQAIKDQFSSWFENSWTQPEYDPETDTVVDERYYPITIPWWDPTIDTNKPPEYTPENARKGDIKQEPEPEAKTQGDTATKNNPKYQTDPKLEPYVPVVTPTDTPSDTGAGAGSSASGLWAVYNPTIAELNDLGAYLWTSNIIDLLEKFLQNPMDAIISLHRIYAQPSVGSPQSIMLGYLNSGVTAKVVTNQFINIDCGSVTVPEYFSDARDYDAPYTVIECYLPFVGIVRFRTEDIVGSTVNIVYVVDAYSGACLCKVFVTKLGAKQMLYTYSGNCSVQIPLTGGDRTRLLSGALTGAIGGATVGGPIGAVVGAVGGAFKGGMSIDHCGGFSANAGCMGIKKPYLIITRKYSYDAGDYNKLYGFPSNNTLALGVCKGFTRVKALHIETIPTATANEKQEIESLLKEGVIIF